MTSNLIYFDATVWISYVLKDKKTPVAIAQINRLNHGDVALVSTLVILEIISVLRKRIIESLPFAELTPADRKNKLQAMETMIRKFLDSLKQLENEGKVKIVNPDMKLEQYLHMILTLYNKYLGDIGEKNYCFLCERQINPRFKYLGLGHYDIQHAYNAKQFYADELITFDKGFNVIYQIPDFAHLKTKVF